MRIHFLNPIVFLFIFLCATPAKAQYVAIPDANFRTWLMSNGYASCMSGNNLDTTCSAVVNAIKVNCSSQNIADLTGIQYFDSLDSLICANNNLSTLPAFPAALLYFDCEGNDITSLPALPTSLLFMDCGPNLLTSLPTLPASLLYLGCESNLLTVLPTLPASLFTLNCRNNNFTSLPALPPGLDQLVCGDNPSLTTLPALPATLRWFNCSNDSLTSLPTLPATLEFLQCDYNNLTSLPALPDMINYLRVNNNPLGSLGNLPDSLTFLAAYDCGLSSLPSLPSKLYNMYCDFNQLTNLPPLPNSLGELHCTNNQLTYLPTLPAGLDKLYCSDNLITSLPTPLPPYIWFLDCSRNMLTSLPVLSNNMFEFYCDSNQITSLPLLPSISILSCSYNPITVLPELPDTMNILRIINCPVSCLPEIQKLTNFQWSGSGLTCVPNYIQVTSANPPMSTLPLCQPSNNCPPYWNIHGIVFKDLNSNCINDSEPGLRYIPVRLDSSGITIQEFLSTVDGNYSFHTYYGTYDVMIDTAGLPFDVTCPPTFSYTSVITPGDPYDSLADFALVCKPGHDLIASGIGVDGIVRPGASRVFHFTAGDAAMYHGTDCSTGLSGSVQVVFSGPVSYTAPAGGAGAPMVNGDTLTWNINDFSASDPFSDFKVFASIATSATTGDTVCVELNVDPTSGDNYPLNNTYSVCFPVFNSFDPNAKSMSPYGAVDTSQQWFTFTIYFQNTGNAPAEDIYLLDTLSNNLDASTFVFNSSSHDVITQLLPGNVLRFNFPDINLVDSVANEPGSHGYVQFRVKRKLGLPAGTVISNMAYIYFDYNPPVITNIASATLTLPVGISDHNSAGIQIYPNPVDDILYIDAGKTQFQHLEIMDLTGRLVYTKDFPHNTKSTSIDLSFLQSGIYFLKAKSGNEIFVEKIVVK